MLKEKLASRKFWAALISFISSILIAFNVDPNTVAQTTAIVGSLASLIIYVISESYVDANRIIVVEEKEEEE